MLPQSCYHNSSTTVAVLIAVIIEQIALGGDMKKQTIEKLRRRPRGTCAGCAPTLIIIIYINYYNEVGSLPSLMRPRNFLRGNSLAYEVNDETVIWTCSYLWM